MGSSVGKQAEAGRGQSLFREVNERIVDIGDGSTVEVLCECGTGECRETLVVSMAEYEPIRDVPDRFLVATEHVRPEVERVVEERDSFVVVEKIGEAARVARELDGRD
jgi:hypothetical protein